MNKFYYLEDMTQSDLNKLALERNALFEEKENLIKYLENKIDEVKIGGCDCQTTNNFEIERKAYQDILERLKSGKYE